MLMRANIMRNRTNAWRTVGILAALTLANGCVVPDETTPDAGGTPAADMPEPDKPANAAPTARVRLAQTFFPSGAEVSLTGAGSTDADNDALSFEWGMSEKESVTGALTRDQTPDIWAARPTAAFPSFKAPIVRSPVRYTIRCAVRDAKGNQDEEYTTLTVEAAGPVAIAGEDLVASAGQTVTLDASHSYHPFDEPLSAYKWQQVAQPGVPMVTLSDTKSAKTSFTAPPAGTAPMRLRFVLEVDGTTLDGPASDTDAVEVEIRPAGFVPGPIANAGADLSGVPAGTVVTLDGSGSSAASGGDLTYNWKQLAPATPRVALNRGDSARPTFTTPRLAARTAFNFQLRVSDNVSGKSHVDTVVVSVEPAAIPDPDPDPDPNTPNTDPNNPVDPNDVMHDTINLTIEVIAPDGSPDAGAAATVFDENFEQVCHDFVDANGLFECANLTPGDIIIVEVVSDFGWYHEQFVVADDGQGEMHILVEF
jgi:chitodextrinase